MATDTTSSTGWQRAAGLAALISLGSVLVLFPAWLPSKPGTPVEDGAVELLQLALLSASTAFLLGASSHVGRFQPIYLGLSSATMAAAVAEFSGALEAIFSKTVASWLFAPFVLLALWFFLSNRREALRFANMASRHPASGFIAAALIIIYVFSRIFGSRAFWDATLADNYNPAVPSICRGYLELLACYFIFVGIVGFCLPARKREAPVT